MIYIFLADGFEEIEALCPLDILRRAGFDVKTVGVGGKYDIVGAHGISVRADIKDTEFCDKEPTLIMLPGGMPGTKNLDESKAVHYAIKDALSCGAYIAAICAAPSILGKMGLLLGKEAICYPGFEDQLEGATISDKHLVLDGNILTAAGMGVALDMGLEIVRIFCGAEKANALRSAVIAD